MSSFREATERYASNMRAAGLDVVVTEVSPGQVRVSGRVQAQARTETIRTRHAAATGGRVAAQQRQWLGHPRRYR